MKAKRNRSIIDIDLIVLAAFSALLVALLIVFALLVISSKPREGQAPTVSAELISTELSEEQDKQAEIDRLVREQLAREAAEERAYIESVMG